MSNNLDNCHFQLDLPTLTHPLEVLSFSGIEALSKPFCFDLEVVSLYGDLDEPELLFADAYLVFKDMGKGFHGQIHSIGRSTTGVSPTRYQITLGPRLGCLAFRHNQRIFQDLSAQTIITKVLREHGIHADGFEFVREGHSPVREFCAQHGETDLELVERLCREEGLHYFFEHSPVSHRLVFTDDLRDMPRADPIHFQTHSQRGEIARLAVSGPETLTFGSQSKLQATGSSTLRCMRAGHQVSVCAHPDARLNYVWLLTEVEHIGVQSPTESGEYVKAYRNHFEAIPADVDFVADQPLVPPVIGFQRARIVGRLFDEAPRDHEERIQVRFEWGHQGDGSIYNDCWIAIAESVDRGYFDWWGGMEVVVSFPEEHPDRPLIIDFINDPEISPGAASVEGESGNHPPVVRARKTLSARLDRKHFLGESRHLLIDDTLSVNLAGANELSFKVGDSHVLVDSTGVTLSSPNIALSSGAGDPAGSDAPATDSGPGAEENPA